MAESSYVQAKSQQIEKIVSYSADMFVFNDAVKIVNQFCISWSVLSKYYFNVECEIVIDLVLDRR